MNIPKRFDNFISSLLLNILLPFLPFMLEFLIAGRITQQTSVFFAAVYALFTSTKSNSSLVFSFSVLFGVILSAVYPLMILQQNHNYSAIYSTIAFFVIIIILTLHIVEKWFLHVDEQRPFFVFDSNTSYEIINSYSNIGHELNRFSKMLPKLFESSMEEIPPHLSRTIENRLHEEFTQLREKLIKDISPSQVDLSALNDKSLTNEAEQNIKLLREISHSLGTPFSQIEATVLTIKAEYTEISAELLEKINAIQNSLNISKSILAAYRELLSIVSSTTVWDPKALGEAMHSAAMVCMTNSNKNLTFEIQLPEKIEGYSNNYILCLVLPILENAVESSRPNTEISMKGRKESNRYLIEVSNVSINPPVSNDIYTRGFTTKENHEGTGLSIVRHLLSAHRTAAIEHHVDSDLVTFKINLPIGG